MYQPTPNQIEVYGLSKTQGQYFWKDEIFAGTFRANDWRICRVTEKSGIEFYDCRISIKWEGDCWVIRNDWLGIFVYTAEKDDMHQEQNKITDLTIFPAETAEAEQPGLEMKNEEIDFTFPMRWETIQRIKKQWKWIVPFAEFLFGILHWLIALATTALLVGWHFLLWSVFLYFFFEFWIVKKITLFVLKMISNKK